MWGSGATAAGISAIVYAVTIARTLPSGDSGDLIAAAWTLGVAHAPGYPLFTMLGRLFALLPFGEPALRINLVSLVFHSLASGLTALLGSVVLRGSPLHPRLWAGLPPLAGVVGALALSFSPAYWTYSLKAEVFALNSFFTVLLLLVALWWTREPASNRRFAALALCCGLAFTNQQTIVLLAPAMGLLLWSGWARARVEAAGPHPWTAAVARQWGLGLGMVLIGLLPYLYLPLAARRNPVLDWGDPGTLGSFWAVVTRAEYGTLSLAGPNAAAGSIAQHLALFGRYFLNGFGPVGCALALLGFWALVRWHPIEGLACVLAFLVPGPLFLAIAHPSLGEPVWQGVIERFYIMPSIPFALAMAAGAVRLANWLAEHVKAVPSVIISSLLLALPAGAAIVHFSAANQHDNTLTRDYGHDMLAALEPNALLLAAGDMPTLAVDYAQLVLGERPDVVKLDTLKLEHPWYAPQVRRQHPDVSIPFVLLDPTQPALLRALIDANLPRRPVYSVGFSLGSDVQAVYDTLPAGLAMKVIPKGSQTDQWSVYRSQPELFRAFRYPAKDYPVTTFEHELARNYEGVAADLAYTYGLQGETNAAVAMYRTAIRLAPDEAAPYKNLGVLLKQQSPDNREVADLWSRSLLLFPNDPQAPAMRDEIRRLRALT